MRRLALLALLLAVAGCRTAGVSVAKTASPVEMVLGGTSTVALGEVVPIVNGQPVLPGSVECLGIAPVTYVPSPARVTEIRAWTERALRWDIDHGILVSPLGVDEAKRLLQYLPNIRFYDKPTYNYSRWPDGTWVWACAQGFAGFDGPKVAADNPARTEKLVVHESVNFYIGLIGRSDLWDGIYVTGIVDAVGLQLTGGWSVGTGTAPTLSANDRPDVPRVGPNDTADLGIAQAAFPESEDALNVGQPKPSHTGVFAVGVPHAWREGESSNPSPASSRADVGDRGATHAVAGGKFFDLRTSPSRGDYLQHLRVGERSAAGAVASGHESGTLRVGHVLLAGRSFKVSDPIVGLDAIQVVDLFGVGQLSAEGYEHEPMHHRLSVVHGTEPRDPGLLVPVGVGVLSHQAFPEGKPSAVAADGRDGVASHASHAGDGVPAAGFNDGSPLFAFDVVYGTIAGSHVSPLSRDSKVRSGVGGATPHRAALILATSDITNKREYAAAACGVQ